MAWRVKWSTPAWESLEHAAEFISKDSPYYAAALMRNARSASRSLRAFANRGRVVPEIDSAESRELFVSGYRLVYTVSDEEVLIVAFIHGRQDLLRHWNPQA